MQSHKWFPLITVLTWSLYWYQLMLLSDLGHPCWGYSSVGWGQSCGCWVSKAFTLQRNSHPLGFLSVSLSGPSRCHPSPSSFSPSPTILLLLDGSRSPSHQLFPCHQVSEMPTMLRSSFTAKNLYEPSYYFTLYTRLLSLGFIIWLVYLSALCLHNVSFSGSASVYSINFFKKATWISCWPL